MNEPDVVRTRSFSGRTSLTASGLLEKDNVFAGVFFKLHVDAFGDSGRDIFAYEIGFERQFAMSSINQHRQLNTGGSAKIVQCVQCGASGASAKKDIVHQNDGSVIDIEGDLGRMHVGDGMLGKIVTMHADIDCPNGNVLTPNAGEYRGETASEVNAACLHANDDDF